MKQQKPKLTLAMATYDDFYGVYATVQGIRANNSQPDLDQIEILVLDNNPEGQHASGCRDLAKDVGIRYEKFQDSTGTSATRQKLIELARGDFVLVMDCHVNFQPGFLHDLLRYINYDIDPKDLFTGPIVYDRYWTSLNWRDPAPTWTHWEYVWCNGMLGMWSTIWDKPGHPSMA
ncbi:MAG: glycosyltransferase, partial [bacterium]